MYTIKGMSLEKYMIQGVKDEGIKELMEAFVADYGSFFLEWPAAVGHHHNYRGGLIEHTLEVYQITDSVSKVYPHVNRDVALAGAFFHDIGKVKTYIMDGDDQIEKTKENEMLDHFGHGLIMLDGLVVPDSKIKREDFTHIQHILASHHGPVSLGWGSLVDPATPEAQIVAQADFISSRVGGKKYLKTNLVISTL